MTLELMFYLAVVMACFVLALVVFVPMAAALGDRLERRLAELLDAKGWL